MKRYDTVCIVAYYAHIRVYARKTTSANQPRGCRAFETVERIRRIRRTYFK